MNKSLTKIVSIAILTVCTSIAASAISVSPNAPGTLHESIQSPDTEVSLTVTGAINANDLLFIADQMPALRNLDLSGCSIEACTVTNSKGSATTYREGLIPMGIFAGNKIEQLSLPTTQNIEIDYLAFTGCALHKISLGANIKSIGQGAFSACKSLESVSLTGSKSLGSHIFTDCDALDKVTLTGCDSIASYMFARCTSLSDISGTEGLKSIGSDAFAGCSALTDFVFAPTLQTIGNGAFANTGLENVSLDGCKSLEELGAWTFSHCTNLKTIALPEGLRTIGQGAFFDCNALGTISLPKTVETVGDYALKGLSSVETLELPSALGHIGTLAMSGMDNLNTISAENLSTVPTLGQDVWDRLDKSDVKLRVDHTTAEDFAAADQWKDFDIITNTVSGSTITINQPDIQITGRFEGNELVVKGKDCLISVVNVYDIAGQYLTGAHANDESVRIDCSAYEGPIFIVEAYTESGMHTAVKLAKNKK